MTESLLRAAQIIREADYLLIGAGAGIGVDSGLSDFRGSEDFWKAYPKAEELDLDFSQMASPHNFQQDPRLAWGFYGHRFNLYRSTKPHQGFSILHRWAQEKRDHFVFTSNVDAQFQKANFSDNQIIECHGSIYHWQCCEGCGSGIWPAPDIDLSIDESSLKAMLPMPSCSVCHSVARPNILMFGDWGWDEERTRAQQQRYHQFLSRAIKGKLVCIEVGAGCDIPTV